MKRDSGNALVVRFGSLGDVILTFAAAEALRRARPEWEIVYLVKRAYEPLVRAQPWVSEVLALVDADRDAGGARRLAALLESRPWQAVLDLQGNPRSRYLTRRLRGRRSRWRAERLRRRAWVWLRPFRRLGIGPGPVRPAWLRFGDAARALAPDLELSPPRVRFGPEAERAADAFFAEAGFPVGSAVAVAPAAAWPTKEWPEDKVLELTRDLVRRSLAVVFVSTTEERRRLPRLSRWAESEPRARWFDGDLVTVAAVLARARVAVTPDSGLLHLAGAVGTPAVALFGSTVPELGFAPAGGRGRVLGLPLSCRPCAIHGRARCPLGHFACLAELETSAVVAETMDLLRTPRVG